MWVDLRALLMWTLYISICSTIFFVSHPPRLKFRKLVSFWRGPNPRSVKSQRIKKERLIYEDNTGPLQRFHAFRIFSNQAKNKANVININNQSQGLALVRRQTIAIICQHWQVWIHLFPCVYNGLFWNFGPLYSGRDKFLRWLGFTLCLIYTGTAELDEFLNG